MKKLLRKKFEENCSDITTNYGFTSTKIVGLFSKLLLHVPIFGLSFAEQSTQSLNMQVPVF